MILSSGNVVHNLQRIDWKYPEGDPMGASFRRRGGEPDDWRSGRHPQTIEHLDFRLAVPTAEHFIPLLYTAGLAAEGNGAKAFLRGYPMGSLSMTCYGVGMGSVPRALGEGAASLPEGVPGEQTNT